MVPLFYLTYHCKNICTHVFWGSVLINDTVYMEFTIYDDLNSCVIPATANLLFQQTDGDLHQVAS